jgi:hypothetical protein
LAISQLLCHCLRRLEPNANYLHILLWRLDSALAFLLKAVQNENCFLKSDAVYRAVGTTRIVFDNFQHSCASKALQHLGGIVPLTILREMESVPEELPHENWKRHQISLAASDPNERLL